MGNYDSIETPVSGQPISSSLFGQRVKDAINDLDRRLSAYDASTGAGRAYSTSDLVLTTTAATVSLTIPGFVFRPGYAYECTMRTGVASGVSGTLVNMRMQKTNATGIDFGEYFRFEGKGASVMSALGTIYLLNTGVTDVVTDVALTAASSLAAANAITLRATAASPRFFTIKPAGFASDYVGMGVAVS